MGCNLKILEARLAHALEIMRWLPDRQTCEDWGGPTMRWPLEETAFLEDIHWGNMPSRAGLERDGSLIAFGQYYKKKNRCHLARLILAPRARGRGLGKAFIGALMEDGRAELETRDYSLFVLRHNRPALACYKRLGFRQTDYPKDDPILDNCIFMVSAID
jgi:ribosomal protein S18 acetylase RimI-like enzyme